MFGIDPHTQISNDFNRIHNLDTGVYAETSGGTKPHDLGLTGVELKALGSTSCANVGETA